MNAQPPLKERVRGRWLGILPALGIDARYLTGKHMDCPICRAGKDRFRFDDLDGEGTWICSHCGAGDGVALVMGVRGWDFRAAALEIEKAAGTVVAIEPRRAAAEGDAKAKKNELWQGSRPVAAGDPVARYLANRAIALDAFPACLRTGLEVRYQDVERSPSGPIFGPKSFHPAMIAMVTGADGKAVTLHRTYLTPEGRKAEVPSVRKLMDGKGLRNVAVRLAPAGPVLGIAEGIETALSASILYGVPVWAAINTALMASWEPPAGVEEVHIFADNDPHHAGLSAAGILGHKLAMTGRFKWVHFHLADPVGADFNDVLQRQVKSTPRAA